MNRSFVKRGARPLHGHHRTQPLLDRDPRPRRARRRRRRTTCCGWRSAAGCSPGPARASTTPSPSASRSSATSRPARSPARPASAPSTRSPTRDSTRCASTRATPVTFTPLKSDALLRLLICDLVGEEVTRESMATLRDDLADIAARLEDAERRATDLPHREKYLLLVTGFLRRFLELHERARRRRRARAHLRNQAQVPATRLTPLPRSGHAAAHRGVIGGSLRRQGAPRATDPAPQRRAHRAEDRRTPLGPRTLHRGAPRPARDARGPSTTPTRSSHGWR